MAESPKIMKLGIFSKRTTPTQSARRTKRTAEPFPLDVVPKPTARVSERAQNQALLEDYFNFPIEEAAQALRDNTADFWMKRGQKRALRLFHEAAQRVPAYKDFLRKNKVKETRIKTFKDFLSGVPPVDKNHYLRSYPLPALCWDGAITEAQIISVSSGSSGKPFFWPRAGLLEMETTYVQELYLNTIFGAHKKSTLYVNCFAMGMYIAGPIILNSALRVSQKGYPMLVLTPGLVMDDILRVIPSIGNQFDQILLAGYPPYIKDVIEEGTRHGINWKKHHVKILVAGEGFNEKWRNHVSELAGNINPVTDIINLYGTADASIVGHETPESILIRRIADHDSEFANELFEGRYPGRLPTLVQYYPTQKYFEVLNNELHFTAASGIPLIRYNIHDDGGVVSYEAVQRLCEERSYSPTRLLKRAGHAQSWKLPFVYLYGRSDFTVVFYGANVYPENIKDALETSELRKYFTGRFVMSVENHPQTQDQYLLIRLEVAAGVNKTDQLADKAKRVILTTLLAKNHEFKFSYNAKGEQATPQILLHSKGNKDFFARQHNKQSWTKQ